MGRMGAVIFWGPSLGTAVRNHADSSKQVQLAGKKV